MTKFILSDPHGVAYIRVPLLTPSRSGLTPLRRGGYDKSDLSEVLSRFSSTTFLYYDCNLSF